MAGERGARGAGEWDPAAEFAAGGEAREVGFVGQTEEFSCVMKTIGNC